jgi:hypothetical protein
MDVRIIRVKGSNAPAKPAQLSVAYAAAQDEAMRLLDTVTPVPSLSLEVCSAASAIDTKMSGKRSCES